MGLETGVVDIADLDETWPLVTDDRPEGDDHLRNIKIALKSLIAAGGRAQIGFPASLTGEAGKLLKVNAGETAYAHLAQGTGNGLDADKLDGSHLSALMLASMFPASLSGQAGKHLKVNAGETAYDLETPTGFVDRGDPAAFDKSTWTKDDAAHDWDLSAIVPAGAKAVLLRVVGMLSAGTSFAFFRKNGNTNVFNTGSLFVHQAGNPEEVNIAVACDSGRVIEYVVSSSGTWAGLDAVVRGWWF
jgi:hypothetical protein